MSGPIDCHDHVNVMTTERALEPVRLLPQLGDLTAVTVRTLAGERRFDVTVRKLWPDGADAEPAYGWRAIEVERDGTPQRGGLVADHTGAGGPPDADPENAYWSAVEALESLAS
jgi:hypothetical protein